MKNLSKKEREQTMRTYAQAAREGGAKPGEILIDDLDHARTYARDGHTPPENTVDKDTNPKDAIGSKKLPLHLVPSSGIAMTAMAFVEGALKYGKYNWRIAGVRASIYLDAMLRHIDKFNNGEDVDPETGVAHLASVCACAMIIMDARLCGKLNDDRPPRAPVADLIDLLSDDVQRLQELFKEHRPHQYTIADGEVK